MDILHIGLYTQRYVMCLFVLGTGCNAAYVEKVDNVDKWTGPKHQSPMVRLAFFVPYSMYL